MSQKPLNVHICEDHDEVLVPLCRELGSKRLKFEDNIMIHFDSHPDLLVPKDLPADQRFSKDIVSYTSIENWIMPLFNSSHVSTVIWMKKPWCHQIKDGEFRFHIGRHVETGRIACTLSEPYFMSELITAAEVEDLLDTKSVTLHVITVTEGSVESVSKSLSTFISPESSLILDVDLDYFSTTDPFIDMYSTKELSILQTLYKYEEKSSVKESLQYRKHQTDKLSGLLKLAAQDASDTTSDDPCITLIAELVNSLKAKLGAEPLDVEMLHEHGLTFDDTGLPHHISSSEEISLYVKEFVHIIEKLTCPPSTILIARSSDDDYCPKGQVDQIQQQVVAGLQSVFSHLRVHEHYKEAAAS